MSLPTANALLAALPPEEAAELVPHLVPVPLPHGHVLSEPEDPVRHVYFPLRGVVSMMAVLFDGGGVETATVGREGAVNLIEALGTRRAYARAVLQIPGDAVRIDAARYAELAMRLPVLAKTTGAYVEYVLAQAHQSVACNARHEAAARMARWLLMCHDRTADDHLPLTQEFLSAMLGVQRTTVSLIARTMQAAGLIRYRRGRIVVLDRPGLEEVACECYAAIRDKHARLFTPFASAPPERAEYADALKFLQTS